MTTAQAFEVRRLFEIRANLVALL